ncbi:hypothetical protein SAMN04488061_2371 [Filomicrobium insigne]|uniref:Uncharacterized protein n=1 Tax=Filomicrobium insigne TaxID=418854 RepID=A0A1H0QGL7_9HYPH|nr:hypothetical protein SAMN04488061_2371 [Filomicrobium insigne]
MLIAEQLGIMPASVAVQRTSLNSGPLRTFGICGCQTMRPALFTPSSTIRIPICADTVVLAGFSDDLAWVD